MLDNIHHYLPWIQKLGSAVLIFLAFYIAAKLSQSMIRKMMHSYRMEQHVVIALLATTVKISILCLGLITAFGTIGVNVSALVASLGLTGFGLSFALKDTLASAISGMMVLLYRPFSIGDHISMTTFSGKVINIDLRYITLLNADEQQVLIPNTMVFKQSIVLLQKQS
jgi:small conductance mechanosensitive channel